MSHEATTRDDRLALTLSALIVAATVAVSALAPGAKPAGPPSTAGAFAGDLSCLEWTDGCQVCVRRPEGVSCSTAGIACTREAPRCERR